MFLEACAAVPEQLQRPLREVADACAIDACTAATEGPPGARAASPARSAVGVYL
jgi:hypothetical protein